MANWWRWWTDLRDIALNHERRLKTLERQERGIMTTIDDIKATVQSLVNADSLVITALNDLKSKVDAGGTVSAQDLDDLQSSLQSEVQRLTDAVQTTDPQPTDSGNPATTTTSPTGDTDVPVDNPNQPTPLPDDGSAT